MRTCYTAIFGQYDTLKEPTIVTPGWKYVSFTDQDFESKVWEIRKIIYTSTSQIAARYYKIMFHNGIDTEDSLWLDGSFTVNCDLNEFWNKNFNDKFNLTAVKHPWRDCIYEEATVCIEQHRVEAEVINKQISFYQEEGIKEHSGLIQSGILLRRKSEDVKSFCEKWWYQVDQYSLRDQLSFTYCMQKWPIDHTIITDLKYFDNPYFKFTKHNLCTKS